MPVDGAALQDRYRILRKLSDKGGMGFVYLAEDQYFNYGAHHCPNSPT